MQVTWQWLPRISASKWIYFSMTSFFFINNGVNPTVYFIFNTTLRREVSRFLWTRRLGTRRRDSKASTAVTRRGHTKDSGETSSTSRCLVFRGHLRRLLLSLGRNRRQGNGRGSQLTPITLGGKQALRSQNLVHFKQIEKPK